MANKLFFLKNKVCLSKTKFLNFFSKKLVLMTLNSLEVTKCCKNEFILFLFFNLHNFLIFMSFIFRIIFERTCYGTRV